MKSNFLDKNFQGKIPMNLNILKEGDTF